MSVLVSFEAGWKRRQGSKKGDTVEKIEPTTDHKGNDI